MIIDATVFEAANARSSRNEIYGDKLMKRQHGQWWLW